MKQNLTPAIIIFLLVALISCCFYTSHLLDKVARQLLSEVSALELLLNDKDWEGSLSLRDQLADLWEEHQKTWALILDHQELEKISDALVRLENRLRQQNHEEAEMELSSLGYLISHVPEKEKFTLQNFF